MLVLSRRVNETIYIGDNIAITTVRIGPSSVRLGITAPKDVKIVRQELNDAQLEYLQKSGKVQLVDVEDAPPPAAEAATDA